MSKRPPSPVGVALRAAGFIPLPRLWVTSDQMRRIREIAFESSEAVNEIRRQVRETNEDKPEIPHTH